MLGKNIEKIDISLLDFYLENPRFYRAVSSDGSAPENVMERMIKLENIQELMGSIGEQGYFEGEPLLVALNPKNQGRYIVVEGNRRLAALKLLNGTFEPVPPLKSIIDLRENTTHHPSEVACIIFNERREILRYLGYRHISGAKRWDPLSKARYLNQLRTSFYSGVAEQDQLKGLAREIGSKPDYVAQMLAGLNVFERAKGKSFFGLQHVSEEDVNFSLLTTALSYVNISNFVGLESRKDMLAEKLDENHARELFSWLFSQNQSGETIIGESRNLKYLAAVVNNKSAIKTLRETSNLKDAYLRTEGPSNSLSKTLEEAYQRLRVCHELVPSVDRFGSEHTELIKKIIDISEMLDLTVKSGFRKQSREALENA